MPVVTRSQTRASTLNTPRESPNANHLYHATTDQNRSKFQPNVRALRGSNTRTSKTTASIQQQSDKQYTHQFFSSEINKVLQTRPRINLTKILNQIKSKTNHNIKKIFIKLTKAQRLSVSITQQLKFLLRCRTHDVFPNHINKYMRKVSFRSRFMNRKFKHFSHFIRKKIMNMGITDLNTHGKYTKIKLENIISNLKTLVDPLVVDNFLDYYELPLKDLKSKYDHKYNNKLNRLINNSDHYNFYKCSMTTNKNSDISGPNIDNTNEQTNPEVGSQYEIKNKWLVNLSKTIIPPDVVDILNLGERFNFTVDLDKRTSFEFLKRLETCMYFNKK